MTHHPLTEFTVRIYEDITVEATSPQEAIEVLRDELENENEHEKASAHMIALDN